MTYHHLSAEETISATKSARSGLTKAEAQTRLLQNGKNELVERKKKSAFRKLLEQFADPMIIVLICAAVISGVIAVVNQEYLELIDAGVILAIVIINAVIGLVQQNKAENALSALKNLNQPYTKVLRDGETLKIAVSEVVVGDIVVLEAGDIVPADMRLLSTASLKIEESALTGESVPVEKNAEASVDENAPLGDRITMAFSGGKVSYGRGSGVVTAVGMQTEVGRIAGMLNESAEQTSPLQHQLAKTTKILSFGVLGIALVLFVVGLIRDPANWLDAFMTSVAIAVAAIPEGLPAVVTIVLAMGVQRMSKRNAIIRNLPAVETLGACQIICSDKTGTLTLNRMTVKKTYGDDEALLIRCMALCNDTIEADGALLGDPTETALVAYAKDQGVDVRRLKDDYPRVNEIPFDSDRKLMTTFHTENGSVVAYTKGAPDMLLARCTHILKGGKVVPLTEAHLHEIAEANKAMTTKALRSLGAAYKLGSDEPEQGLVFLGLMGMIDPPRTEVKAAVATCLSAGIRPLMITGDHKDTAAAIAEEIGILRPGDLVMTGAEIDAMDDEVFAREIEKYSVFARVSPENKVRIVKAYQSHGKVVAMTGDGVNDAPSIKSADIGIGMGITGTEVSKGAADMVLADDNFATIVGAVEEGRKIYANVTKAINFLLSANVAEVLCLMIATLALNVEFLTPIMILWVNLVTDSLPALALGTEKAEKDIMAQPPRNSKKSLFAGRMGADIIVQGVIQTALVMLSFCLGNYVLAADNHAVAMTMAFVSLCFIQLFHSYNLRARNHSLFSSNPFANGKLNLAFLAGVVLSLLPVLIPGLHGVFSTAWLTWQEWLISIGVAVAIIPIMEIYKAIARAVAKRKAKR